MTDYSILIFADEAYHKIYRVLSLEGEKIGIYSCSKAFDVIKEVQVEVALIDCGFDIKTGLKLLKELKQEQPAVPVLFLTDESSEDSVIQAFRSGARDYVKKPINIFELKEKMKDLLEMKRSSREERIRYYQDQNNEFGDLAAIAKSDKSVHVLSAIQYIEENFTEKIDLATCAKQAKMSKYHFCRYFKEKMGLTPMKFIKILRIAKAKKLLQRDDLSLTEIALATGFGDYNSLYRNFKRFAGLSPKSYRDTFLENK